MRFAHHFDAFSRFWDRFLFISQFQHPLLTAQSGNGKNRYFFEKKLEKGRKNQKLFFIFYRCKTWFHEVCAPLCHVFFRFWDRFLFIFRFSQCWRLLPSFDVFFWRFLTSFDVKRKKRKNFFIIFYRCKSWFHEVCAPPWRIFSILGPFSIHFSISASIAPSPVW